MPLPEYLAQAVEHRIIGVNDVENLCAAYHQLETSAIRALHPELAISEAFELLNLPERTAIRALVSLARKLAPHLGKKVHVSDLTEERWADKTTEYWLGRAFAVLPSPWTLQTLAVVAYAELADAKVRTTFINAIGADNDILPRWMSDARQLSTLGDWLHLREPDFHRLLQTSLAARLISTLICRPLVTFYTTLANKWEHRHPRGLASAPSLSAQVRHELALTAQHLCLVISASIQSTINNVDDELIRHLNLDGWRRLAGSYVKAVYRLSDLFTSLRTMSRLELSLAHSATNGQLVPNDIIRQIDQVVTQAESQGLSNPFSSIPALLAHIGRLDAQPIVYAPEQLQEIAIELGRTDRQWNNNDTFPAGAWWQQEDGMRTRLGAATGGPSQIQQDETEKMKVDELAEKSGQNPSQKRTEEIEAVDATEKRDWAAESRDQMSLSREQHVNNAIPPPLHADGATTFRSDGAVYPLLPGFEMTPELVLNGPSQRAPLHNSRSHIRATRTANEQSASVTDGYLNTISNEERAQRSAPVAGPVVGGQRRENVPLQASSVRQETVRSRPHINPAPAAHKHGGIDELIAAATATVSDLESITRPSTHNIGPATVKNRTLGENEGSSAVHSGPSADTLHACIVKKLSDTDSTSRAISQEPAIVSRPSNHGGCNSPILISSSSPTEPSTSDSGPSSPVIAASRTDPVFTDGPNLPSNFINPPPITKPFDTDPLFTSHPATPSIIIDPPAADKPPITVHPSPSLKVPRMGTFPVEGRTRAVWPQFHYVENADDSVEVRYTIAGSGSMERKTFPHRREYLGWQRDRTKAENAQGIRVKKF